MTIPQVALVITLFVLPPIIVFLQVRRRGWATPWVWLVLPMSVYGWIVPLVLFFRRNVTDPAVNVAKRISRTEESQQVGALLLAIGGIALWWLGRIDMSRRGRLAVGSWAAVQVIVGGVMLYTGHRAKKALRSTRNSDLTARVAATYAMQYLADHGSEPSKETVLEWMRTMDGLTDLKIIELGSDMQKCKLVLERR